MLALDAVFGHRGVNCPYFSGAGEPMLRFDDVGRRTLSIHRRTWAHNFVIADSGVAKALVAESRRAPAGNANRSAYHVRNE